MSYRKSMVLIITVYVLAFGVAVLTAIALPFDSLIATVLVADVVATLFVYMCSTLFKNTSVYDPYWSVAPLVMVPFFVESLSPAVWVLLFVLYLWGIRLTLNWAYTFKGLHEEDWRYALFRERFPRAFPLINLFCLHMMPTVVVFLITLPAFLLVQSGPSLSLSYVLIAIVAVSAVIVQGSADYKMHTHRAKHPGKVLKEGIWRYSRHPNYFGEILFWFAIYGMMAVITPDNALAVIGPLINLLMFLVISIPLMEKRCMKRVQGYAAYKETTSMLVPLPFALHKEVRQE